jgi:hypothetical protein
VDGVVDAVRFDLGVVVLLAVFELHASDSLEEHRLSILEFVLLVLEQLYHTFLRVRDLLHHDFLKLLSVLVKDLEYLSEVIEHS